MRLRTETENQTTIFLDGDREVYRLPQGGGAVPDDMRDIVTEFLLVGEVMTADVTDGGSGWSSSLTERLERRRMEMKDALMDIHIKKEIQK